MAKMQLSTCWPRCPPQCAPCLHAAALRSCESVFPHSCWRYLRTTAATLLVLNLPRTLHSGFV